MGSNEDREHLEDLEDGAGCVEIWKKLSERRSQTESREN